MSMKYTVLTAVLLSALGASATVQAEVTLVCQLAVML